MQQATFLPPYSGPDFLQGGWKLQNEITPLIPYVPFGQRVLSQQQKGQLEHCVSEEIMLKPSSPESVHVTLGGNMVTADGISCNQVILKLDAPLIQYDWCPNKRRGNRSKEETAV